MTSTHTRRGEGEVSNCIASYNYGSEWSMQDEEHSDKVFACHTIELRATSQLRAEISATKKQTNKLITLCLLLLSLVVSPALAR